MSLLVTLALLLQAKTAEETFKTIEETITKAKTLRVKFEISRKTGEETVDGSGTLLLKEGNKAKLDVLAVYPDGSLVKELIVSDGTNVKFTAPVGDDTFALVQKKAPDYLLRSFYVTTLQLPLLDSSMMTTDSREGLKDLTNYASVREFKHGEADKEGNLLLYKGLLDFTGRGNFKNLATSFEEKLWYDANTWIPRKRQVTLKLGTVTGTTTETYEHFVLNDDIPNENFSLTKLDAPDAGENPAKKEK
jgi:outer membrane lipoprotein-sorting protein